MTFESLLLIIAVSLVFGIMIGVFFERIREFVVTLYLRLTFKPKMLRLFDYHENIPSRSDVNIADISKASRSDINKPSQ